MAKPSAVLCDSPAGPGSQGSANLLQPGHLADAPETPQLGGGGREGLQV